jgi:molybdopterin/thiamine biosynthesis adenylyltransferase
MDSNQRKIKKVAIAGAGGIGGFVCRLLFDFGVNRNQFPYSKWTVDLFDNDTVDAKNLLHQDFTQEDLGREKAQIMADRYMVTPHLRFMTKKDFPNYDVIFSCVDSMTFRKELYNYGWDNPGKLFWIDGRCNSRNIGLYNSSVPKKMMEGDITDSTERKGCLRSVDKENNISHVTPIVIASMMVQCFLNYLRNEEMKDKVLLML